MATKQKISTGLWYDGEEMPNRGVFLEVTPGQRMVFTDAVDSQWNPREPFMIGILAQS